MNDLQPPIGRALRPARRHPRTGAHVPPPQRPVGAAAALVVVARSAAVRGCSAGRLVEPERAARHAAAEVMSDAGSRAAPGTTAGSAAWPRACRRHPSRPADQVPRARGARTGRLVRRPDDAAAHRVRERSPPQLTTSWAAVFSGAYAADRRNTRIVVTLTRPDAALEALVTGRDAVAGRRGVRRRASTRYADKARPRRPHLADAPPLAGAGRRHRLPLTQDFTQRTGSSCRRPRRRRRAVLARHVRPRLVTVRSPPTPEGARRHRCSTPPPR